MRVYTIPIHGKRTRADAKDDRERFSHCNNVPLYQTARSDAIPQKAHDA
jgi:hypothetical protein